MPNRALMAEFYLEMSRVLMMREDAEPGKNHLLNATVAMTEGVKLYSGLAEEHPKDSLWTVRLARCYCETATLMRKRNQYKDASEYESGARKSLAALKATGPHSEEVMAEMEELEKLLSEGPH